VIIFIVLTAVCVVLVALTQCLADSDVSGLFCSQTGLAQRSPQNATCALVGTTSRKILGLLAFVSQSTEAAEPEPAAPEPVKGAAPAKGAGPAHSGSAETKTADPHGAPAAAAPADPHAAPADPHAAPADPHAAPAEGAAGGTAVIACCLALSRPLIAWCRFCLAAQPKLLLTRTRSTPRTRSSSKVTLSFARMTRTHGMLPPSQATPKSSSSCSPLAPSSTPRCT
jgi:hypothetical protein